MDPARKSRSGVISVIAALAVVGVFWLIFLPRTEAYKAYKLKADLKHTLQALCGTGTLAGACFLQKDASAQAGVPPPRQAKRLAGTPVPVPHVAFTARM